MKRTRYGRKRIVRIASDQANRTNHQYQNNGQHDRILGDVLALVVPQLAQKITHIRAPSPEPILRACASTARNLMGQLGAVVEKSRYTQESLFRAF